jgi:hypothetical protein
MEETAVLNGHAENHTTSGVDSSKEEALLCQLEELWQPHYEKDLEVRFQMGVLLNDHPEIGPPTERKSYGEKIMIRVAERLALTPGELSRLRWFAHHFQSVEEFHSKHPEVKSWQKVKVLLAKLSPAKGNGEGKKTAAKNVTPRLCQKVTSSLEAAVQNLRDLGSRPEGEDADKLLEKIQDFVEAVNSCLQVRLTFEKR